jgi:hypothetical protein
MPDRVLPIHHIPENWFRSYLTHSYLPDQCISAVRNVANIPTKSGTSGTRRLAAIGTDTSIVPRFARLQDAATCRIYTSDMSSEVSGIVLVGAFGAVAGLCAFFMPKLYRVGASGKTPPPPRDS